MITLSPRERQIAEMLVAGHSPSKIAKEIERSYGYVSSVVRWLRTKFTVTTTQMLIGGLEKWLNSAS